MFSTRGRLSAKTHSSRGDRRRLQELNMKISDKEQELKVVKHQKKMELLM